MGAIDPEMGRFAMVSSPTSELSEHNKQAWDELYASTPELVWGGEAVGFLPGCLPPAASLPEGPALDAAAGEGRNLAALLGLGRAVVACDSSAAALAKIPRGLLSRITTTVCDLAQMPFPDATFAFILLSDAIETLPDPRPALAEMRRALLPGGCLLANVPANDDGAAGIDMQPAPGGGWLYRGRFYYRFYNRAETEGLFTSSGLAVADCVDCHWTEKPHPHFRADTHRHHSRVVLSRRQG